MDKQERNLEIIKLHSEGLSTYALARKYKLTQGAIWQIIKKGKSYDQKGLQGNQRTQQKNC